MRITIVLLAVCCCLSAAKARGLETTPQPAASLRSGFNSEETVRQARAHRPPNRLSAPSTPAFDDGEFLIDTSTTYVPAPLDQWEEAIAFDGTNFLVVWEDFRGGDRSDIFGARVTPEGVVLDSAGIPISTAANYQEAAAIAFGGENFLVVWWDAWSCHIYGARVTPAGEVLDPAGIAIATNSFSNPPVAVASDGENFLVVWRDFGSSEAGGVYGARVTPAGEVLDPAGIAIATAADYQGRPAVAFDGGNFLVVWQDYRGVYGARVTPAGVVLDPAGIAISTAAHQSFPNVAFDGESFLVVWDDEHNGNQICGARVTPTGVVLDSTGIPISPPTALLQSRPAIAFDGEDFLVAWEDGRSGSVDIYGARVTSAGVVLDSAGIAISTAANWQWSPALAFDGDNFLTVWHDGRSAWSFDIYGARVTPAGTVLDSTGVAISTAAYGQGEPVVAFDGTNFLAVWEDERTGGGYYDIYGARVTPAGVVLDTTGIAIATTADNEWHPAVAFDGQNFLVAWQDRRGDYTDIYGARVTPAGAVLDPEGIAISTAADDQRFPALVFDSENFLVVWEDYRGGSDYDIYGARVTQAGKVLDSAGFAISTAAGEQQFPALAFDGQNFLVAWQDQRGVGGYDDMYGARVTPTGDVLDTAGIAISTTTGEERFAALAFDGDNFLVVWENYYEGVHAARVTPAGVVLDSAGINVATASVDNTYPAIAFDGEDFLAVWRDSRGGLGVDLYRARVRPDGTVFDKGPVVSQEGNQSYPALARGPGHQVFLVYQGWAGVVGGKAYNVNRIWGKTNAVPAVAEMTKPEVRMTNSEATIVRGVLFLRGVRGGGRGSWVLHDAAGRMVMDLTPGANDVRSLSPGVYFVRERSAVTKVVLTR